MKILLSAALALVLPLSARAATAFISLPPAAITWSTATNISGDSDVNTTGSLVRAFNVGDSGVSPSTVNGVLFESFAFPNDGISTTVAMGNFNFTESLGVLASGSTNSTSNPYFGLSPSYQTLLSDTGYTNNISTLTLTLSGLTSGQQYLFQWWANVSRPSGQLYNTSATATNTVSLSANTASADGGLGQFATGTFTPASTNFAIAFNGTSAFPSITAFQLRAVPEPSSAALLGLGVLLLARRRRVR